MAEPVDVSKLSPEELTFYQKFGRLPKAKPAALAKQQRVPHDSADRELSKLAPGAKAGGPVKPAGNPLLMRKAPPPRTHVKSTTTEQTWKDETAEVEGGAGGEGNAAEGKQ